MVKKRRFRFEGQRETYTKTIKTLLTKGELLQKDLAKSTGYSAHNINKVILGTLKTPKVRKAIAKYLNMPYEELWGEKEPRL